MRETIVHYCSCSTGYVSVHVYCRTSLALKLHTNVHTHIPTYAHTRTCSHITHTYSLIRLEFNSTECGYYTELDGVELTGSKPTSQLMLYVNA